MNAVSRSEARSVLITGASGFTGKWLAGELSDSGYRVIGCGHSGGWDRALPYYSCDLRDRSSVVEILAEVRPEFIVHLAGIANIAHSDISEIYEANVLGTQNVLEGLRQIDCVPELIVVASSASVYGVPTSDRVEEVAPCNPVNHYGTSKYEMEKVLNSWRRLLPIAVVRPFNYTGVGQTEVFIVPKMVRHFRLGAESIELGNVDVVRDFSDVRDVVKIYQKLLDRKFANRTFNVCSGVGRSLREILFMLGNLTGHCVEIRHCDTLSRRNEIPHLVGDGRALQMAIGPIQRRSFEDTLRWMMEMDE
jgi:nucleoside-diphosphate-sugar epimerase